MLSNGPSPTLFVSFYLFPPPKNKKRIIGIVDALILAGIFDMCCLAKLIPSTAPLIKSVSGLPLLRKESCDSTVGTEMLTRENSRDTSDCTDVGAAYELVPRRHGW